MKRQSRFSHRPSPAPTTTPLRFRKNRNLAVETKYVDHYRESVYYTDAMLGQLLKRIQSKPWYQNTLVIITADTSNNQPPE